MHYFVSLDYMNQDGLLKTSPVNTYNTNTGTQRYIFQSNVEAQLTPRLSMHLNLFGRIRDQNEPGNNAAGIFTDMRNTPNNAYPVFNPDSSLGGNVNYSNNIYAQSVLSGYQKSIYSDGYADLGLKRNMDDVLKGWWVKGLLSYNLTLNQLLNRSKAFETFQMHVDPTTGDTTYQRYGTKTDQKNNSSIEDRDHQFYVEASTGYTRQWKDNALDVLFLYNMDNYTNNSDLPEKYQTLSARVQYSIQNKYMLEAVGAYSGNSRYEAGDRFGFFPAVGVAWNVQNESFFNQHGFINALKLRASYGLTGNAVAGYYDYVDRYGGATGYYFGTSVSSASGRAFKQPRDVKTWEKALKLDVGLDMRFAKTRGMFSVDYYHHKLRDLVQPRGQSSALLGWGSDIIQNLGRDLYSGLELTAGWSDHTGAFSYYISGNFSVSGSKVLFNDEPDYPYAWMGETGHRVGQLFGYVADGFVTQAGGGPVVEGYNSVPGDLKYKDLNDDGVINQFDKKAIGRQKPLMFYGVDMGFSWKHLSLSVLVQGTGNRSLMMTGANEWAFQNDGKGQAWQHHLGRWTAGTAASATYPRLSIGTNVNNDVASSFWIRSGDYLRLKNAEIAWSFNHIDLGKVKISQLRVFLNGFNLLTAADFKQSDPETLSDVYPIQRVMNGGVSIKF
jgi:TonB-linked SusC/RagA family outer membrane protein